MKAVGKVKMSKPQEKVESEHVRVNHNVIRLSG